jgi:aminoglycoside phosphotransferase (APT) family kinase protein
VLTIDAVVPFLRDRGLLDASVIVDDDVRVADVSRRNRNFTVVVGAGPRYLVKQGQHDSPLQREAHVYGWLARNDEYGELARIAPHYRLYDEPADTMVLDLVDDSESLFEHHARRRRISAAVGRALGEAVATLHQATKAENVDLPMLGPAERALQLYELGYFRFVHTSRGTLDLARVVQQTSTLTAPLSQVATEWRELCAIHGDLRWDNCRISDESENGGPPRVTFVDWETAGAGDPCCDIGTVFAQCLSLWLASTPLMRDAPVDASLELTGLPLPPMRPALRAFWRAYLQRVDPARRAHDEWLERSVRYAAARLVQSAFEDMQYATELTATVIYQLQLSQNMLERPLEAAACLIGIPPLLSTAS